MTTRRKTGGRTKGTPNKVHAVVKEAITAAFDRLGGEAYLVKVGEKDPKTFCTLLGKVLPMQLTGAGNEPIRIASEGNESARDRLFAKIEQMALRHGGAAEPAIHKPIRRDK